MAAIASSSATRMWRGADGSRSGIIFPWSISAYRQRYGEAGPPFQAFRSDPSSHGAAQTDADGQSRAYFFGGVLGGEERIEDTLGHFRRKTDAIVGDGDPRLLGGTVREDRHVNPPARRRVVLPADGDGVAGIAQQV